MVVSCIMVENYCSVLGGSVLTGLPSKAC